MRPVLALLLLALLPLWSAAQTLEPPLKRQPAKVKTVNIAEPTVTRPQLEIAVHSWSPYAGANLPYFGIVPHIVSEALTSDGTQVHYHFMHWSKALDKLSHSEIDAAVIWASTDMNLDIFAASAPLLNNRAALFYRKDRPFKGELASLGKLRMAWVADYVYDASTYQKLTKHQLTAIPANNEEDALRILTKQQADIFLTPYNSSKRSLMKLSSTEQSQLGYTLQKTAFPSTYLLINSKRPDAKQLLQRFNTELTRMHQDGRYNRIIEASP